MLPALGQRTQVAIVSCLLLLSLQGLLMGGWLWLGTGTLLLGVLLLLLPVLLLLLLHLDPGVLPLSSFGYVVHEIQLPCRGSGRLPAWWQGTHSVVSGGAPGVIRGLPEVHVLLGCGDMGGSDVDRS